MNIQSQTNTSKVIKGMSSQTIVTIALGLVEIVSFSIMSRLLTADDFGYFAAISAITTVFGTFSETGIGSAIVQQKELNKRYIDNAFTISLIFGTVISISLFALSGVISRAVADESMMVPLMLMAPTLLLYCLTSVNTSLMHRKRQFMRMGMINLVSLVITTGVAIWLAYKGYGYYAIIIRSVMGAIITFFLSLIMCHTRFGIALDKMTFKRIFSFSGWLMASSLFRHLSHQVDKLLMPRLLSVAALGSYNRPKGFIEQISNKLNNIFDTALFPVLSGIQDDKKTLKSAFLRSMSLMNIFGLYISLAFLFNSGLLIRIFFGSQWESIRPVMMIISCSLLFNVDGRLSDCYLRSLALTKQQFYFRIFEFVLKTAGVLIGYRWDIIGVALSVVVTNFIAKIVKIIYVGGKVDVGIGQCIGTIVSAWQYAIVLLPVSIIARILLPDTWAGDIIMTVVFVLTSIIIFLCMPKLVGKSYQDEVYSRFKIYLRKRNGN